MADIPAILPDKNDPIEKKFRDKNLWHSFMQAAYGALGGASFFGALMVVSQGLIGLAAKHGGIATALGPQAAANATASAFIVTNALPLAAIGGLIAVGLAFTYMSQREGTELKVIQDEHLAQQTELQHAKCRALEQNIVYAQNQRADGKQWQEVLSRSQPQVVTRH